MDHLAPARRFGFVICVLGGILFLVGLLLLHARATPLHLLQEGVWALLRDVMLVGGLVLAVGSALLEGIASIRSRARTG